MLVPHTGVRAMAVALALLSALSLVYITVSSSTSDVGVRSFFKQVPWTCGTALVETHSTYPHVERVRALAAERWGADTLRMSVINSGTGARMRRALARVKQHGKLTIGVLGGSITYGHDLEKGERTYSTLLQEGLKAAYPDADITVVNGAVPATGTDYFSACYQHHVPPNADIYILESAVNDLLIEATAKGAHSDVITDTETLVRELLDTGAAVVMLTSFSVISGYLSGADRHASVAAYYDIPRVSARVFMYPYIVEHLDARASLFATARYTHPNQLGHQFHADILLDYMLEQASLPQLKPPYVGLHGSALQYHWDPFTVPRLHIDQKLEAEPLPNPSAYCLSANVKLPDGKWQLQAAKTSGFREMQWNNKHYWGADEPGAQITFDDIPVRGGSIGLYYQRSDIQGLGNLGCWVDDDQQHMATLVGYWTYVSVGSVGVVATGVAPGTHSITCRVLEETEAPERETDHEEHKGRHKARIIAVIAS